MFAMLLENITLKVFGIKYYAEFGDMDDIEFELFVREPKQS